MVQFVGLYYTITVTPFMALFFILMLVETRNQWCVNHRITMKGLENV